MERKQSYELLYIIPAKYTEAEVKSIMDKVKGIVEAGSGKVSEMHNLGKRRLAYPVKHVRFGNYVLVWFTADPAVAGKINDVLRLTAEVLRHVVVTRNPLLKVIPSFAEVEPIRRRDEIEAPRSSERSRPAPVQAPSVPAESVNAEELDKKLDKILNEKVL